MNTRHHKIIMQLANVATDLVDVPHAKLCAAIVLKNNIVSFGTNSRKTHPFQKRFGKSVLNIHLHAEIAAIKNALKKIRQEDLKKATLYVARTKSVKDSVVYGMAKPCVGCQRAIIEFGIKRVIYTNEEETKLSVL